MWLNNSQQDFITQTVIRQTLEPARKYLENWIRPVGPDPEVP